MIKAKQKTYCYFLQKGFVFFLQTLAVFYEQSKQTKTELPLKCAKEKSGNAIGRSVLCQSGLWPVVSLWDEQS